MVLQDEFQHRFSRLLDSVALRRNHHPLADESRAGSLQLRHLGDFYKTHPASTLQR
jgi:hypothetical protein